MVAIPCGFESHHRHQASVNARAFAEAFFRAAHLLHSFYQNNDPAVQRDFMRSPYEIGVSCFLCSVPVFQSAHGNPPPRFSHAGAMDQPVLIAAEILFMSKKNRYDQTHHSADQVSGDQNEISSVHYGACGVSREWPVDRAIYGKRRRGLQSGAKACPVGGQK